jgi:hypothetical protein
MKMNHGLVMIKSYYVSCRIFTIRVDVNEDEVIVFTADIAHKFFGQPFENLKKWIQKFPPVRIEELNE